MLGVGACRQREGAALRATRRERAAGRLWESGSAGAMLTEQYDGDGEEAQKPQPFRNKNKVLILSSRGIGYRIRHLMQDFIDLCPHAKKDVKIAEKSRLESVNEVCEMKGCNLAMFFEARKGKDFYLWLARSPDGPSMKFHMLNSELSVNALGSLRAVA